MEDEMFDQNPSEENTDQENTPEETTDQSDSELEKLRAENAKLEAIIKRRKEREAQKPSTLPTQVPEDDVAQRLSSVEKQLLKQAFAKKHDIPESAMDTILAISGGKFDDSIMENDDAKAVIARHKSKNRVSSNTPSASNPVFSKNGKTWEQMDTADKKVHFKDVVKAARDRGKSKR
jgi:hypothetical protein